MLRASRFSVVILLTIFVLSFSGISVAETQWQKTHPRRAEVNKRLANQNKRINNKVKNGKMSPDQAQKLKAEDRAIRQEERNMAKLNGGHITKAQQKALNQQENAVSNQIKNSH
ncbi:MAG: hypothetical protein HQK97_06385 [Nitrospirae bacterium]|nr:hypothetical protein [Nitrospirota bacterium]